MFSYAEMNSYIPIDKNLLPSRILVDLEYESFFLEVSYNELGDFFSCDLLNSDEDILVYGEKFILGRALFENLPIELQPATTLVPFTNNQDMERVTFENFGESVFLFIVDGVNDE